MKLENIDITEMEKNIFECFEKNHLFFMESFI